MLMSIVHEEPVSIVQDFISDGVASWQQGSVCVANEGNEADFVYCSLLLAPVVVQFPDGRTMSISPTEVEKQIAALPVDVRFFIKYERHGRE